MVSKPDVMDATEQVPYNVMVVPGADEGVETRAR